MQYQPVVERVNGTHEGAHRPYQLLITAACTNTGGKMKGSHSRAADRCPFVPRHSLSQVTSFMQLGMLWQLVVPQQIIIWTNVDSNPQHSSQGKITAQQDIFHTSPTGRLTHIVFMFITGNIKNYLGFVSFLNTEMAQVVKIHPHGGQWPIYPAWIPCLLMVWKHKGPGHQLPRHWLIHSRILHFQHQKS